MANVITALRFVFGILILFFPLFSSQFYIFYICAGLTDMLDGFVARRMKCESEFGSKLDSIADLFFIIICIIKIIPKIIFPKWLLIWTGVIALLRVLNLIIGYVRQKKIIMLHTVLNKVTGFLLFVFPLTLQGFSIKISGMVACFFATFAAIDEGYKIIKKV